MDHAPFQPSAVAARPDKRFAVPITCKVRAACPVSEAVPSYLINGTQSDGLMTDIGSFSEGAILAQITKRMLLALQ